MSDTQQRWIEVESKLAFLEAANDTLNETIIAQQQQIDQLAYRLEVLSQRVAEQSTNPAQSLSEHEIPPHY